MTNLQMMRDQNTRLTMCKIIRPLRECVYILVGHIFSDRRHKSVRNRFDQSVVAIINISNSKDIVNVISDGCPRGKHKTIHALFSDKIHII